MNTFQSVRTALKSATEIPALPYMVENGVEWLTRFWLYFRVLNYTSSFTRQYRNIGQQNALVYGTALQYGSGYIPLGSAALNIALIGKCATDIFVDYENLHSACQRFSKAISWHYPVLRSFEWNYSMVNSISPSLYLNTYIRIEKFTQYMRKIAVATFNVFVETFKLSMDLVELCLLVNDNNEVRNMACVDLMVKWEKHSIASSKPVVASQNHIEKGLQCAQKIEGFDETYLSSAMHFFKENTTMIKTFLDQAYKVGSHTLDSVVVPGKITTFSFQFRKGVAPSQERFPAWDGREIIMKKQPSVTDRIWNVVGSMWK